MEPIKKNVFLDMETGDPDDCITLLFLLDHPNVELRGVSVYPGDKQQIGFVKALLEKYSNGRKIPVGSFDPIREKNSLGQNNVKLFGGDLQWKPDYPDGHGCDLMAKFFSEYPGGVLVTGGPLGNLYNLLTKYPQVSIDKVFIQGGFAGALCVPEENQLPKFKGKYKCPTFNFNGHKQGALAMLKSEQIKERYLISKDVCHGVAWTRKFHEEALAKKSDSLPWALLLSAMGTYLNKRSAGKLLHDPLAACAMIDPSIVTFLEVNVSQDKGEWGSKPVSKMDKPTNTYITIGVDKQKFYRVLLNDFTINDVDDNVDNADEN
eukprot:TRINITY_DN5651_c0_g1_i1.p1 TRINITY_DN5651_c0_g1~~TRINITY_DN5651_c0_g1_i1.p1  ORF type:complete len:320 (+),score=55.46 TRINITY_DN5651_c0_g1_i1:55-1014(+)